MFHVKTEYIVCPLCQTDVKEEYHFILKYPFYSDLRKVYIEQYFWKRPSVYKLIQIFNRILVGIYICIKLKRIALMFP